MRQAGALARSGSGSPEPAGRTEQLIAGETAGDGGRWTLTDLVVAAGIFLAAGLLILPAVQTSRVAARQVVCQDNLRSIGQALVSYSVMNEKGNFPQIAEQGNMGTAGAVPVQLKDSGFFRSRAQFICPSSRLAEKPELSRVPTEEELRAARGRNLNHMLRYMGGSYGYYLGHLQNGVYQNVKNRNRLHFALVSDAPSMHLKGRRTASHNGRGQFVLYEDGHVRFQTTVSANGDHDQLFMNHNNLIAAGLHVDDVVIGRSNVRPFIQRVRGP